MDNISVKTIFDKYAESYDRTRRQLIPCFDEFYAMALSLIPYGEQEHFRIIDLGAGTGLLASLVAKKFVNADITLMDISEGMLVKARERFSKTGGSFNFVTADYSDHLTGEYDVVVSALSIHHLEDTRKKRLFQRIYEALSTGGVFINADQVLGETPENERVYRETWLRQVRHRGVAKKDLDAALERMKEDKMASLNDQLDWLRRAGFGMVDCWYKNYSFVVFSGQKQGDKAMSRPADKVGLSRKLGDVAGGSSVG